jgi:hypothetical protein
MKSTSILLAVAVLMSTLASAAAHPQTKRPISHFDYNLRELAKTNKIELFNRTLDQTKADSPEAVFLNAAPNDGLAWITGVELSEGAIELEIKGKNQQGQSFVGIAFHGQDNAAFDAVYLRPFNFQAAEQERRSHAIQYISMPQHDWSNLRKNHSGKYEFAITPAPDPNSWVKLKVVVKGKNVAAFVNGSDMPALSVELLNDRLKGKVGLWVGNGSDGGFRNLKVTPASATTIQRVPPRNPSTKKNLIDLSGHYNGSPREGWLPTTPMGTTAQKTLPITLGVGRFDGVDFDVRGLIQLSGNKIKAAGGEFPEKVTDIKVGLKCRKLYFLQAAAWGSFVKNGVQIGSFTVHYVNDSKREILIVQGEDLGNWTGTDNDDLLRRGAVVWKGENAAEQSVRVYKSVWDNPQPELEIRSLDFVSKMTDASPFLIAITAE